MYYPKIKKYIMEDFNILNKNILTRNLKYKGKVFNVNPSTLNEIKDVFKAYENNSEKRHYTEIIQDFNNVYNFTYKKMNDISEHEKLELYNKIDFLEKKNFIFLINDVNWITNLSENFWKNLINKIHIAGFDIFINTPEYTIPEAVYIASQSKAIIGLRCGFSEILSSLNIPKHIIYTACKWHNIKNLRTYFSLEKYPFVNKSTLNEYELDNLTEEELLDSIPLPNNIK